MRVVLALCLAASLAARADETTGVRERLRDANAQYNMGNYPAALEQFQSLYRSSGRNALLFNIAQCYRQLGDLHMAAVNYRSFLRLDPDSPAAPMAKDLLAKVEEQLSREDRVKKAPPTGVSPEAAVVPPAAAPSPWQQAQAARAPEPRQRDLTLPIAAGALAVACAGAGAVFGLQARSAADDWKSATADPAWSDARSRAQSAMTRANVAWVAAGVFAAAAAATLLIRF